MSVTLLYARIHLLYLWFSACLDSSASGDYSVTQLHNPVGLTAAGGLAVQ